MFKKILFILVCVAILGFAVYKITGGVIVDEVDNANMAAVERYASAVKLSAVNINNVMNEGVVDYNSIDIGTSVKCDEVKVLNIGEVELHGCSIEGTSRKYKYVNGKASRE